MREILYCIYNKKLYIAMFILAPSIKKIQESAGGSKPL